jgi:hypothetical protein
MGTSIVYISEDVATFFKIELSEALSCITKEKSLRCLTNKGIINLEISIPEIDRAYIPAYCAHFFSYNYFFIEGSSRSLEKKKDTFVACLYFEIDSEGKVFYLPCFADSSKNSETPLGGGDLKLTEMTTDLVLMELSRSFFCIIIKNDTEKEPKSGFYPKRSRLLGTAFNLKKSDDKG